MEDLLESITQLYKKIPVSSKYEEWVYLSRQKSQRKLSPAVVFSY